MEDSEKLKFQDLFEKLSLHKNHLTEDYINMLIALLETKWINFREEIYKYTLYYFIINLVKIKEIMKVKNEKVERVIELLMNYLQDGIDDFKAVNEVLRGQYSFLFKEKIYENQIVNSNKNIDNNYINNLSEKNVLPIVISKTKENLKEKTVSKENINYIENIKNNVNENAEIQQSPNKMVNILKSNNNHLNNDEIKLQQKNQQIKLINIEKEEPKMFQNFEQKKINNQIISNSNPFALNSLNELSLKDQKGVEDIRLKIDNIFKQISESENIAKHIKSYFNNSSKTDLFSNTGFFVENSTNKIKFLHQDHKMKLITIYSRLYFLFTEKQKLGILNKFKSEIFNTNLLNSESKEIISNLLFYTSTSKNILEFQIEKDFLKEAFKKNYEKVESRSDENIIKLMEKAKYLEDIKDLFYYFTLNKVYLIFEEDTHYKLLFLLYLQLNKNKYFRTENCFNFLYDLHIIKLFHGDEKTIENNNLLTLENSGEIIYKKENLNSIKSINTLTYKNLFNEKEIKYCKKILSKIKKFFVVEKLDYKNILTSENNNFKFTMNLVELCYKKEKFLASKNLENYKNNLMNLEKNLYHNYQSQMGKEFKNEMNERIYSTNIYEDKLDTFREINKMIQNCISKNNLNVTVNIYPFGSITQFLGNKDSDLDIYMNIYAKDRIYKINFLNKLYYEIRGIYRHYNKICTKRLLTISYTNNKNVKIDLNYFGILSVLNSSVLRVYSQCDERFVILAHNIKIILKTLKINNTDDMKVYLNSFGWMSLLVTFLQDIVNPPVLPKILNKSDKMIKLIEAGNGNKIKKEEIKSKQNYYYKKQKDFDDVIYNTSYKEYEINEDFFTDEKIQEIFQKFNQNLERKNEMSLSELLLKFLEFIIFYFKYDSIFVHTSFAGECFMNKSEIKKLETQDKFFYESSKYLMKKKDAAGDFFIREPFDHGYNPGQTMNGDKTKEFIEKLKRYYFNLMERGELC